MLKSKIKNYKMPWYKIILRYFLLVGLYFFSISLIWVFIYRFINPPITFLMVARIFENIGDGKSWTIDKKWNDWETLSLNLKKAAIAGEDAKFLNHNGFDFKAISKAYSINKKSQTIRGGSTISQQTAKNVFLWHGRSYIRKAFEAYFTVLIELIWGKKRILEVYLNVIEMGDGIYGAERACQIYYNKSSQSLTKYQSSMLIACLPNPRRWTPAKPTSFLYYKQKLILNNMKNISTSGLTD